jgi:hypothetical protein
MFHHLPLKKSNMEIIKIFKDQKKKFKNKNKLESGGKKFF